mgnify:CR=1 FL=1
MTVESDREAIAHYYETIDRVTRVDGRSFHVDRKPLGEVMVLFEDNASYAREGHPTFEGKAAIEDFFAHKRPLSGSHHVASIIASPGKGENETNIIVHGQFIGAHYRTRPSLHHSEPRTVLKSTDTTLDFVDYWQMRDGKVVSRESSILPAVKLERTGNVNSY